MKYYSGYNFKYASKIRPQIAIFDFTDCEGCELQILAWKEKLLDFSKTFEIVNWRLIQEKEKKTRFDIALVEGTPVTKEEQKMLKALRKNTDILVALGSCAHLGGIQGMIKEKERKKITRRIYGRRYRAKAIEAKPLSAYVDVDLIIPGCPADIKIIEEVLGSLVKRTKPKQKPYSVCSECKLRENNCLLKRNLPCLGPITAGGCGAICPSHGLECFGCYGKLPGTNWQAMQKNLLERCGKEEAEKHQRIFLKYQQIKRKIIKR